MFIEITNPANPLRTENFLRPYKRGEKPFTPDIARQILQSTNHPKNIRDTLQLIAEQQNQAQYKEIILSAFDHREQPADTITIAKNLAATNGFADELNALITKSQTYDYSDNEEFLLSAANEKAVIACAYFPELSDYPENCTLYCVSPFVKITGIDLSTVKSLKFREGAEVYLSQCENLPADLDVSMCDKVILSQCDLSPVKTLKFKEGAEAHLSECKNLPADLDVSMCNKISLVYTDLSPVKSLKFKQDAHICLDNCENLPADLDVSTCYKVTLSCNDLSPVKSLSFKDDTDVDLSNSKNLPAGLDVSMCKRLDLTSLDLASFKSLKFKKGTWIYLKRCKNLPADLDVSMCDKIDLSYTNLSSVKSLKFKNKQQQLESEVKIPQNWNGTITYTQTNIFTSLLHKITTRNR